VHRRAPRDKRRRAVDNPRDSAYTRRIPAPGPFWAPASWLKWPRSGHTPRSSGTQPRRPEGKGW